MFKSIIKALNRKKFETIERYIFIRGVPQHIIENASATQLMQYPEATVITILDNYKALTAKGFSESDAITKIDNVRSNINPGVGIVPKNIMDYVFYRLKIEHSSLNSLPLHEIAHFKYVVNDYLNEK